MSTQMKEVIVLTGTISFPRTFKPSCTPGDTQSQETQFAFQFPGEPVVIVTCNNLNVKPQDHNAAVVGIAQKVTASGFVLQARNSDSAEGFAGFNWMAILEVPGKQETRPPSVRMRVLQPQLFNVTNNPGDTLSQQITFWSPMLQTPVILLTESNHGVNPSRNENHYNPAVVGICQNPTAVGFKLTARNSDLAGQCAFYYAAVLELPDITGDGGNLLVDTGLVNALNFPSGENGPSLPVDFHRPFLTPPVVLLTPNDRGVTGHNAGVVGIVQDVSPYGFTLRSRSSDCAPGQAGFNWVALGCSPGCG